MSSCTSTFFTLADLLWLHQAYWINLITDHFITFNLIPVFCNVLLENMIGCKSDIVINELQVTSYELISLQVAFISRVTSYELFSLHELRVTFCIRVTSYCLLHELRVTFITRVTSYCFFTSYELLFIPRVTSYFLHTSYELIFTNYFLTKSYNKD